MQYCSICKSFTTEKSYSPKMHPSYQVAIKRVITILNIPEKDA